MDTPPPSPAFPHQAAKLSWVCPIIVLLLLAFGGRAGARVVIDLIALLLILLGLGFGVLALFGLRTHGKRGILGPAMAGIVINALLLFIFVTNFWAARAQAPQQKSEGASSRVAVLVEPRKRCA